MSCVEFKIRKRSCQNEVKGICIPGHLKGVHTTLLFVAGYKRLKNRNQSWMPLRGGSGGIWICIRMVHLPVISVMKIGVMWLLYNETTVPGAPSVYVQTKYILRYVYFGLLWAHTVVNTTVTAPTFMWEGCKIGSSSKALKTVSSQPGANSYKLCIQSVVSWGFPWQWKWLGLYRSPQGVEHSSIGL